MMGETRLRDGYDMAVGGGGGETSANEVASYHVERSQNTRFTVK